MNALLAENQSFTALDRCDRCGARAAHRTQHTASEMAWCAHHFREFFPALAPKVVERVGI